MAPAISLCHRELIRFLRQRHRIIGALATPIVFWLLIGAGMNRSFQSGGAGGENYLQYFFPGTVLMIILFTAIFSTISVIEDRREGFLQGVLVAPVSRMAIVLGKVMGGTILAVGQALVLVIICALTTRQVHASVGALLLTMVLLGFALTSLGLCIAWRMTSTQGFHAIMNLFLMPMWFLSGALFPVAGAFWILRIIMKANPLTYGLAALRQTLYAGESAAASGLAVNLLVTAIFALSMFALASVIATGRTRADLE
jgi:ABC-2 type transport system permease protein